MKKTFLLLILLYSINSLAQVKKINSSAKPYVTPSGTPFGKITSAKIDTLGGKLRSEDGGLEVIIPEGALDTGTTISIQSIHNELNENDQGAYQLEPSGIQFKKPLQLIFHFNDANANLKRIAWQDEQGIWHSIKDAITDTVQKNISCFASHFSRWSRFDKIYLSPNKARVKVNKTISLTIISLDNIRDRLGDELTASSDDNSDDALLTAPHPDHYYSREWTANGIVNGDNTVGTVTKQDNRHAIYKAPGATPQNNPVAVSVQIYSNNESNKLLLTSNIDVFDGWHYTFIGYSSKGCFKMIDSSSCDIRVQNNKIEVSNIINYKPWSDWPQCDAPACNIEWTNKDTWKGLVEIGGAANAQFTGAAENSPAKIYISLIPAMGNTPSAKETCPKDTRVIPSMPMPAMPNYISFDITGPDTVLIHFGGKSGTNVLNSVVNGDGFVIRVTK
ncbi:MAG: hypothetical protein B6D37_03580 [Sphingobacteriales bacterium UTBCD1]|jgi:hypothetical protein|nr:MAG: hypothetical protein B6D37_03580 [Sphingobacteriales bacterium UTBCD1]